MLSLDAATRWGAVWGDEGGNPTLRRHFIISGSLPISHFPPAINRMLLIKTRPQKIGLERKWFRSVDHEKIASVKKRNSESLTRAWKLGTPLSIKWVNEWINEQTSIQKDITIECLLCVGTVPWMWIQNQMSLRNAKCPQEVYTSVWSRNIGDHGHPQWRAP